MKILLNIYLAMFWGFIIGLAWSAHWIFGSIIAAIFVFVVIKSYDSSEL